MYLTCEKERSPRRCIFWKKDKKHPDGSCTFNEGSCKKILEACLQCEFVDKTSAGSGLDCYCLVYMDPLALWKRGKCPMFVDPEAEIAKKEEGKRMNPLKASRRRAKGRSIV